MGLMLLSKHAHAKAQKHLSRIQSMLRESVKLFLVCLGIECRCVKKIGKYLQVRHTMFMPIADVYRSFVLIEITSTK